MGLLIENLLRENMVKLDINRIFHNTPLYNNEKFISESAKLLFNNNDAMFLKRLYETAEEMDALLDICVLSFSVENSKLGGHIATFSLPAGWSCPFADQCSKKVERLRKIDPKKVGTVVRTSKKTGDDIMYKGDVEVHRDPNAQYDCYAANMEMQYDAKRENNWHNFDLLRACNSSEEQADLIQRSLEYQFSESSGDLSIGKVRIHEGGDFYNGEYLKAWLMVAKRFPNVNFYAYTKSVPYVREHLDVIKSLPNFILTLSQGGKHDSELDDFDIKQAKVYRSPEDVLKAGLLIDLDDSLAQQLGGRDKHFALLVHGTQQAGEDMQVKLRNETFLNYWKNRKGLIKVLNSINVFRQPITGEYMSKEQAEFALERLRNPNARINDKKQIITQLNYVVKYEKYQFNPELINVIPPKFR